MVDYHSRTLDFDAVVWEVKAEDTELEGVAIHSDSKALGGAVHEESCVTVITEMDKLWPTRTNRSRRLTLVIKVRIEC